MNLERGRKLDMVRIFKCENLLYSSLSTSRGAGNFGLSKKRCIFLISYRYLSTSRGVGNNYKSPSGSMSMRPVVIAPYLPREGPETSWRGIYPQTSHLLYSSLSTSQVAGNLRSASLLVLAFV